MPPLLRNAHWGYVQNPTVPLATEGGDTRLAAALNSSSSISSGGSGSSSGNSSLSLLGEEELDVFMLYSRYTMATTPYTALGIIPIAVAMAPPM